MDDHAHCPIPVHRIESALIGISSMTARRAELTDDGLRQVGGCVTAAAGKRGDLRCGHGWCWIADLFRVVMSLETMIIVCAGA
jgi:hypothetical protein